MVNRSQLQEVDWTCAAEPNVFGFICCAGESAAWLLVPPRDRWTRDRYHLNPKKSV